MPTAKTPPVDELADWERKGLVPPGTFTSPRPARAKAVTPPTVRVRIVVRIDGLALRSEANAGGKLREKIARKSGVKAAVSTALIGVPTPRGPNPVPVKLVRVGGKRLDSDNLARSFKAVQDVVARELLGCDDGDGSKVRWSYHQKPGYSPGVIILVG